MKILYDNKQGKKEKAGFFIAKMSVSNLGGYPILDEHIGVSDIPNILMITSKKGINFITTKIEKTGKGLLGKKEKHELSVILDWDDINYIEYAYDDAEKAIYKNKSVVGRAIVGGVLTGGIGTIVGGMSGVGQKKMNSFHELEALYSVNFNDNNGETYEINLSYKIQGRDKTMIAMYNNNRNSFKFVAPEDKFLSSRVVEAKGLRKHPNETTESGIQPASNLDELKKLKELLDMNAITQEEFDKKKAELLNL